MPNGGLDNCGECQFNDFICNKNNWYCSIRETKITKPFYTYCKNAQTHHSVPEGSVYASGLHDKGHTRIPWYGKSEPRTYISGNAVFVVKFSKRVSRLTLPLTK